MTCFVSSDLVHPQIYQQNVGKSQTKQRNLLLEHFLVGLPVSRIESLSINHVEITDTMQPDSFCASFSSNGGVKNWKFCAEDMVEKSTFSWALGSKNGYVRISCWKFAQVRTEWKHNYLILRSSRIIFIM